MQPNDLDRIAGEIRLRDLKAVFEAGAGHIGGEMSAIDILTALYFRVLRVFPQEPTNPIAIGSCFRKAMWPWHYT